MHCFARRVRRMSSFAGFLRPGAHSTGHASPAVATASTLDRREMKALPLASNPHIAGAMHSGPPNPHRPPRRNYRGPNPWSPPFVAEPWSQPQHWRLQAAKGNGASKGGNKDGKPQQRAASTFSAGGGGAMGLGALAGLKGLTGSVPPPPSSFGDFDFKALKQGDLVEFMGAPGPSRLVQLTELKGSSWTAVDSEGQSVSVAAKDIDFVLTSELPASSAPLSLPDLSLTARALLSRPSEAPAGEDDTGLLRVLWEAVLAQKDGSNSRFTLAELSALVFPSPGEGASDAAGAVYATYKLIQDDKIYFQRVKRAPATFKTRARDQVDALSKRKAEQEVESGVMVPLVDRCFEALSKPRAEKPTREEWAKDARVDEILRTLELYALQKDDKADGRLRERALQLLNRLGRIQSPNYAVEVLEAIGFWPPNQELPLMRSQTVRDAFPPNVVEAAERVMARYAGEAGPLVDSAASVDQSVAGTVDSDSSSRRDLTSLFMYTIDDAETKEIDDGLSVRREENGRIRVWIHVADPSAFVRPGDELDREALLRSRTLYLPTRTVPMFPRVLAEGPFSLREGLASNSLTLECVLDERGDCVEYDIYSALVTPTRKLTYVDADDLILMGLPEEQALLDLHEAALRRKAYRERNGCITIDLPECRVDVEDPKSDKPTVNIEGVSQHRSASRQLVAEMMILAGEIAGRFGAERRLPLPYRGQAISAKPDPIELSKLPPGPAQAMYMRRLMTRSVNQVSPARHDGLGLPFYVQVTSPIRRYGDMLAHYQIKAYLEGAERGAIEGQMMTLLIDQSSAAMREGGRVEGECTNYWVAYYFAQQDPRRIYPATLMGWNRNERGLGSVLLEGLGLEVQARLLRSSALPGDAISLKVAFVEVRGGTVRLEEANATEVEAWVQAQQDLRTAAAEGAAP